MKGRGEKQKDEKEKEEKRLRRLQCSRSTILDYPSMVGWCVMLMHNT